MTINVTFANPNPRSLPFPAVLDFFRCFLSQRSFSHSHNNLMMPDPQDLFTQATELVEFGRLDEALALFLALIKTDSNNATIWNNLGIIFFRQGKYREAVNAFGNSVSSPHAWG
jgi:tetratricopeptide (TPR) repeat protein